VHRPRISRVAVVAVAGAVIGLGAALPALAAERGAIVGRVINQSTGEPQPGVAIVLTSGTQDGSKDLTRRVRTDARGRYEFRDLPTGGNRFYALDARFGHGTFAGRAISIPSNTSEPPVIDTTLRVWETTTDPAAIVVSRNSLFVVPTDDGAFVLESVTVANTSDEAYIGRGRASSGDDASGASIGFALPPRAQRVAVVDSDIDIPALIETDSGVAATVAFPPGETRVTLSYEIAEATSTIDLSRPALYPTLELSIYAEEPLEIRSNRLSAGKPVTLEGTRYARWSSDDELDAGDPLQAIAVRTSPLSAWPVAGIAAAALLVAAIVAVYLRRRPPRPAPRGRTDLLTAVAELDLAYEAGDLPEERWRAERAELRSKLEGASRSR